MKKNQRGFTHNMALLVLGVFVFAAVGFAGFRVYEQKNSDSASATGYTQFTSVTGAKTTSVPYINSCRKTISTIKGQYYQVIVSAQRKAVTNGMPDYLWVNGSIGYFGTNNIATVKYTSPSPTKNISVAIHHGSMLYGYNPTPTATFTATFIATQNIQVCPF